VKPRRRVFTGKPLGRRPTVRRVKPAITPAQPKPRPAGPPPLAAPPPPAAKVAEGSAALGRLEAGIAEERTGALDVLGARPVDLEVDLGRGLLLSNPIVVASGPFGYGVEYADAVDLGRLGGIWTRSTTLKPRVGNPMPRMIETAGGLLNGVGLQNPGVDVVAERYAPTWRGWDVPVIVSLAGGSVGDYVACVRRLDGLPGIAGIELNLACPNSSRGGTLFALDESAAGSLTGAVRRATELPLIVKLSPGATDARAIARAVEDAGADAISAVNTLTGLAVSDDRTAPYLASGYGGLSGPALRPVALRVVYEVAQAVDVPVIGIGGVTTLDDVLDFLAVGASAVGVGTGVLADPGLPVRLADDLADACRDRGLDGYRPLIGTALPKRTAQPAARGAEYRP
jgi:dihydroorotate dehydrogenase (NAD+) catalytic subunit